MHIEHFGKYTFLIIALYSLYIFYEFQVKFFFFVLGYVMCVLITFVVKLTLQLPVPKVDVESFYILKRNPDYFEKLSYYEMFGMPSGEAVISLYALTFISFCTNRFDIPLFLNALLVTISSVVLNYHYVDQVVVGAFIGCILGALLYFYCNDFIVNRKCS